MPSMRKAEDGRRTKRNRELKIDIMNTKNKYDVVYADPPWEYKESGGGRRGTANLPYEVMTTEEICNIPVRNICKDDTILYIWATFRKLKECLRVISAWGFEYYGLGFDWTKTTEKGSPCFGMGYYTRQNNEVCLIGVKKKQPKPIDRSVSCVVWTPRREHSRKPDAVRNRIKKIHGDCATYIELFSRNDEDGWDCWGKEAGVFKAVRESF